MIYSALYSIIDSSFIKDYTARPPIAVPFDEVITCGLSARDTVSCSSINEESATFCLQRSLCLPDGTTVEPQEVVLKKQSGRAVGFPHLAAAAICFLIKGTCGKENEE